MPDGKKCWSKEFSKVNWLQKWIRQHFSCAAFVPFIASSNSTCFIITEIEILNYFERNHVIRICNSIYLIRIESCRDFGLWRNFIQLLFCVVFQFSWFLGIENDLYETNIRSTYLFCVKNFMNSPKNNGEQRMNENGFIFWNDVIFCTFLLDIRSFVHWKFKFETNIEFNTKDLFDCLRWSIL